MQWQSLLVIELDDYCGGTVSLHRVDRVAERGYLKESSVSISIPLVGWAGVVSAGEGCILDPARPSLAVAVSAAVDYSPPWIDVTVVSSSCVLDIGVCFRRSSRACSFASCVMDWNANSPLLWDWDNHAPFGGNYKLSASSGSEHGHGSSSKSTISASVDSSSKTEKDPDLEGNPKNFGKTTFTLGAQAAGVEESQIGLKLGKRTYFEDVSAESSVKNPRPPTSLDSSVAPIGLVKKSRVPQQITHSTCCQVEGCDVDLTGAKDYHRKHRICEAHSKCPRVVVAGQVRRFCQQCSRFHDLSEFDQKKRSCRRRLSDHNARRRKPRPNIISFTSTTFSSFYDEKNQMNFLWNKAPLDQMRTMVSTTSEDSQSFKYTQLKGPCVKLAREGNISRQLHMPNTQIINGFSALYHDVDKLLPLKGTATEILNQGSEASAGASNLDGAPDIRRALSLLSDSPWGSPGPRQTSSIIGFVDANSVSIARPMMIPTVNSSHWMHEHSRSQAPQMLPFTVHRNSNQPHDFQLQKEPRTSVP